MKKIYIININWRKSMWIYLLKICLEYLVGSKLRFFKPFFVYFLWFYRKKKSAKRYFDCVSQNDLRFSTSNIDCIQDDDISLIRRLLSKLDGGGDSYCWFRYIEWLKILDKNLLFYLLLFKKIWGKGKRGGQLPPPQSFY